MSSYFVEKNPAVRGNIALLSDWIENMKKLGWVAIVTLLVAVVGCSGYKTQSPGQTTTSNTTPSSSVSPIPSNTPLPSLSTTPLSPVSSVSPSTAPEKAAIVVAGANASAADQARATYHSNNDGHDEVPIQNAIDALPVNGDRTILLIGDFTKGNAAGISLTSKTTVYLKGTISLGRNIDADASVFTNSDKNYGNTGISIIDGTLIGNEEHNNNGNQYAINFVKVTNSVVNCWIEGFRTADELMLDSNIQYINRNYDDKYTLRTLSISNCESTNDFDPSPYISTVSEHIEGKASIQARITGAYQTIYIHNAFDLRFYPMISFKFKVTNGAVTQYNGEISGIILTNSTIGKTQVFSPTRDQVKFYDLDQEGWQLATFDITSIDWAAFGSTPDLFLENVKFGIQIANSSSTILFDDIYAIRGLPQAIVTQIFDDGFSSVYAEGTYMNKYGYSGVVAVIPASVINKMSNYLNKVQLDNLYQSGWDLSNHSFSHPQSFLSPGAQYLQDAKGRAWLELQGYNRSAKYRFYTGGQSQLDNANSEKINAARRYFGTASLTQASASLPYGTSQQCLNSFVYQTSNAGVQAKVAASKRFHTWQLVFCHGISATETPVSVYQGFIDYLHSNGMLVRTMSEVYTEYPLAQEPQIDFSLKHFELSETIQASNKTYIMSNEGLTANTPFAFTLDHQPDVSRSITWGFNSHKNITAYTILISGKDAKNIPQEIKLTEVNGWSGETSIALTDISVQLMSKSGTGAGDTLNIGIGSKIGLPHALVDSSFVFNVQRNNVDYTTFTIDVVNDTIDIGETGAINGDNFSIYYGSNLDLAYVP
jgi:peptidoglycan/xylan/chitin deacetylase (PgdA/CDA1 family)